MGIDEVERGRYGVERSSNELERGRDELQMS
jgi:hypothetical protein